MIVQDVHKLRIVPDPNIHYDLLRFCQHTHLAIFARNVPPDVLMRPADVNSDTGRWEGGSGLLPRTSLVPVPVFIQDSIVQAILQRGLGDTFSALSAQELAWCQHSVPRDCRIATPSGRSGHYAFACFGNGSFLQRDCSHGLLAGFAPSRL
jgi:hypothetical protein